MLTLLDESYSTFANMQQWRLAKSRPNYESASTAFQWIIDWNDLNVMVHFEKSVNLSSSKLHVLEVAARIHIVGAPGVMRRVWSELAIRQLLT